MSKTSLRSVLVAVGLALSALACTAAYAGPRALHTPTEVLAVGTAHTLRVTLRQGAAIHRVVVRLRLPGRQYTDIQMDFVEGETFATTLAPGRVRPPGFEYYLEGITKEGRRVPLYRTAEDPVRVLVSSTIMPDAGSEQDESEPATSGRAPDAVGK